MIDLNIDPKEWNRLPPHQQIDAVCDAFELDLKLGKNPIPEQYVSWVLPDLRLDLLKELILIAQEHPNRTSYLHFSKVETVSEKEMDTAPSLNPTISSADEKDSLPRSSGRYILHELVGQGSFGSVFRAEDIVLGRTVAIKIPHHQVLSTAKAIQGFIQEARSVAKLDHPGIARILHVEHSVSRVQLVSEYIEGINLRDCLKQTNAGFPPRMAAQIVKSVAEAIHHAHLNKVVHRDLKPSNIMLVGIPSASALLEKAGNDGKEVHVKVIDFGSARILDSDATITHSGDVLGTPAYMSPEQAIGESNKADARSDVYSLGVVLFELLSGNVPFRSVPSPIYRMAKSETVLLRDRVPEVDLGLETICSQCLKLDSSERYATAQDLANDLARWLNHERISLPVSLSHRLNQAFPILLTASVVLFLSSFLIIRSTSNHWFVRQYLESSLRTMGWYLSALETDSSLARARINEQLGRYSGKLSLDEKGEADASQKSRLILARLLFNRDAPDWSAFANCSDPRIRSYLTELIVEGDFSLDLFFERLNKEKDATAIYGLLVALGSCDEQRLGKRHRDRLVQWTTNAYLSHPNAAIHSASRWILQKWGDPVELQEMNRILRDFDYDDERDWYYNSIGMQMIVIRAPLEFDLFDHFDGRSQDIKIQGYHHRFENSFAISATEVTQDQYSQVYPELRDGRGLKFPQGFVTWIEAMQFCEALSRKEGLLGEKEPLIMVEPNGNLGVDLKTEGYRLPTVPEWECSARGGTETDRYFGTLLSPHVELYSKGSSQWMTEIFEVAKQPPNPYGLFDCLGNAREWLFHRTSQRLFCEKDFQLERTTFASNSSVVQAGAKAPNFAAPTTHSLIMLPSLQEESYIGFRICRLLPNSKNRKGNQHAQ